MNTHTNPPGQFWVQSPLPNIKSCSIKNRPQTRQRLTMCVYCDGQWHGIERRAAFQCPTAVTLLIQNTNEALAQQCKNTQTILIMTKSLNIHSSSVIYQHNTPPPLSPYRPGTQQAEEKEPCGFVCGGQLPTLALV